MSEGGKRRYDDDDDVDDDVYRDEVLLRFS